MRSLHLQQVSDLVAVVKANHVQGNPRRTTHQNSSKNGNQTSGRTQIFGGNSQLSTTAGPSENNKTMHQCYLCWGWGHMVKECVMPLNYIKEGNFNVPSPKVLRDQQE